MNITSSEINSLHENGFILKKNILNGDEIKKVSSVIKLQEQGKGNKKDYYPTDFKKLFIKLIKFEFTKVKNSLYFLNLEKKLNLNKLSNDFFEKKSKLVMLDCYHNKKQENEIVKWHSDQAYTGAKDVKKIVSPDHFFLKIFFYLTTVGPNNGCTSYVPGSHKITYALRSCFYENKIKYEPFWEISDLVNVITKKNNYNHVLEKVGSKDLLEDFIDKANLIISDNVNNLFDFSAAPGDVLIFNEGGVHRGTKPFLNERIVLRYLYSKIN